MHAILNVWFLFNFGETYNQIDIRKARYWFANAVLNMKNEQIKKNKKELLKGRSIQIAKEMIIETIGKGDPFTLLKDLINERKESTCAGFTLGPNDIFTSSDSEDAVEYNEKISSPNENLSKFIIENGEYLRAVVDGSNKDPFEYSDRLKALKVLPTRRIMQIANQELNVIEKNRKEYGELFLYTNELMFGPLTREYEKIRIISI